jgi:hypothetical protein
VADGAMAASWMTLRIFNTSKPQGSSRRQKAGCLPARALFKAFPRSVVSVISVMPVYLFDSNHREPMGKSDKWG